MTAILLPEAENDLEEAFNYYEQKRRDLGIELLDEFRRAIDLILSHPNAWQAMDDTYRRCRLHRFPYGIIYRIDIISNQIVVTSVMHLSQHPSTWQRHRP